MDVTDSGSPALSTQKEFTIIVLDFDDNLPQFEVSIIHRTHCTLNVIHAEEVTGHYVHAIRI